MFRVLKSGSPLVNREPPDVKQNPIPIFSGLGSVILQSGVFTNNDDAPPPDICPSCYFSNIIFFTWLKLPAFNE